MRNLFRRSLASTAIALATVSLQTAAFAQEAAQPDEPATTIASPLADATWMKRYVPLDENTLGMQRGGTPGFVMVAAVPSGNASVTLWDEIAPPAPLPMPIPVDAQRVMQGNNASYTRK